MLPLNCFNCFYRNVPIPPMVPVYPDSIDCQSEIVPRTGGYQMEASTQNRPATASAQTPQMGSSSPFEMAPGSPVMQDSSYIQGYLRSQIGKRVLISFLIGTNTYQDRSGVLEEVGISYVILREPQGEKLMADIYSIKFVRIFND